MNTSEIRIVITSALTGRKAILYEYPGKKGRRTYVPTFFAYAEHPKTGDRFEFAVTRDSSFLVFGETSDFRYGAKGECPPSRLVPYQGIIREDGPVGFRIEFFDSNRATKREILAPDGTIRTHLQIHVGSAASFGCFLVAGGRSGYARNFVRPLRRLLWQEEVKNIAVIVEERE